MRYKYGVEKEFNFREGDEIKIIAVSFLYASEDRPEHIYHAQLLEVDKHGFWAKLLSSTVHPYSNDSRLEGETEIIKDDYEEYFGFGEICDVIGADEQYPDRNDWATRFVLDGPSWK
ncbi:hypothetical protein ACFSR7_35930 [Cohnella sp. GCM10020058]|uniref:hypothetical protein n=1 Tax=Cohnella sp. GCM10020058 TaxID=3317330 RepID=UPI00362AA820